MAAGPYELDGTSCSGHIVVEGQATKAGACVGDAVMATLADPVAAPPICAEFPSGRSSSGTIAGLKRVDSASPTTCCRKAAPLMVDSKLADETATASNLNNRHAGQDRTSRALWNLVLVAAIRFPCRWSNRVVRNRRRRRGRVRDFRRASSDSEGR